MTCQGEGGKREGKSACVWMQMNEWICSCISHQTRHTHHSIRIFSRKRLIDLTQVGSEVSEGVKVKVKWIRCNGTKRNVMQAGINKSKKSNQTHHQIQPDLTQLFTHKQTPHTDTNNKKYACKLLPARWHVAKNVPKLLETNSPFLPATIRQFEKRNDKPSP